MSQDTYLSVDFVPVLQEARQNARVEAWEILENNRQLLIDGEFDAVPLPVDALGTAKRAVDAKIALGVDSETYESLHAGLVLDCRRLYAEAARKKTYEYFPPVRHEYHPGTGEYFSHGQSILAMTELGLSPISEQEERERRVNERVEEMTYKTIGSIGLSQTVRVMTVSECTDWAIDAHARNSKGGFGGYVPEIEKLMIRDVVFDPVSNDRFEEQVGLSGKYITHEVVTAALGRRGHATLTTKTEVHGTQLIHDDDLFEFVELLDTVAGEFYGEEIYMGEVLPPGRVRDYASVRSEAEARQVKLEHEAGELADFVLGLAESSVDRWAAVGMVEAHVKRRLINMADKDNSVAADIFDERTAKGLQEVAYLRSVGRMDDAQNRLLDVEAQAPEPGYCGAGSCGLDTVKSGSKEDELAKELGFSDSKDLLRDKERKCKCGSKTILYDLKKRQKGCTSCKKTESYK